MDSIGGVIASGFNLIIIVLFYKGKMTYFKKGNFKFRTFKMTALLLAILSFSSFLNPDVEIESHKGTANYNGVVEVSGEVSFSNFLFKKTHKYFKSDNGAIEASRETIINGQWYSPEYTVYINYLQILNGLLASVLLSLWICSYWPQKKAHQQNVNELLKS